MVYFSLPHSCLTLRLARRYSEKYVLMCHWSLWHESGMFFAQHVNHTINRPLAKLYITADAILRLDRTVNPLPRIGFLLWCPLPSTAWFCVRVCLLHCFVVWGTVGQSFLLRFKTVGLLLKHTNNLTSCPHRKANFTADIPLEHWEEHLKEKVWPRFKKPALKQKCPERFWFLWSKLYYIVFYSFLTWFQIVEPNVCQNLATRKKQGGTCIGHVLQGNNIDTKATLIYSIYIIHL